MTRVRSEKQLKPGMALKCLIEEGCVIRGTVLPRFISPASNRFAVVKLTYFSHRGPSTSNSVRKVWEDRLRRKVNISLMRTLLVVKPNWGCWIEHA